MGHTLRCSLQEHHILRAPNNQVHTKTFRFFFKENLVLKQYHLEALRVINNGFKQKD